MAFTGDRYVTQDPSTGMWVTIFDGNTYGPFASQAEAEQSYNNLMGSMGGDQAASSPGQAAGGGAGGYGMPQGAYWEMQAQQLALQYKYQQTYLDTYLIPQMQMLDKRERARLALDATTQYAELSGWMMPQNFLAIMKYGMGGEMSAGGLGDLIPAHTNVSNQDMANIRTQLESAGWQGGTDEQAIDTFLKTAGNDPTQAGFAQKIQGALLPEGAKPTVAGAAQMAAPYSQGNVMGLLGTNEGALAGAPGYQYQGQPTLATQRIMGNPAQAPQSLMMQGMSQQQAGNFLSGTPFVKNLLGAQQQYQPQQGSTFGFLQGRQLSPQTVANWSPDQMALTTSLAQFSGQRPENFWADYKQALPQGSPLDTIYGRGPTRIG